MWSDLNCPYCDGAIEVCNDDGFGIDESRPWSMDCPHCSKAFVFHSSLSLTYVAEQADCLNGGEHKMIPYPHYPRYYPGWQQCETCGHEEGGPDHGEPPLSREEASSRTPQPRGFV
jgi:hypothetical protein